MFRIDISRVEYPINKNKRGILIPKTLTPELAELDGIIRSDGSVFFGKDHHNDLIIYGNSSEDFLFLKYHLAPLIRKVHGQVAIKLHKYPSAGNCLRLEIHSKAVASFWNRVMGIPNNKLDFKLHSKILADKKLAIYNLGGYFDGDGSINFSPGTRRYTQNPIKINYYPLIDFSTQSKTVAIQIKKVLRELKFHPFILKHIEKKGGKMGYVVRIGGRADYENFVSTFTLNNPVHLTKILIYEIFGHCPPKTSLSDRLKILKREKSPLEFYEIKPSKIRPIQMKENEEKILRVLSNGPLYSKAIMEKVKMKCISSVLKRLENFGQIKCLGIKKVGHKRRFYEITDLGVKRLNRILELKERLKNQFHLEL